MLWDILKEEYGFKQHVFDYPINTYQEFRKFFLPKFWLKWFPVKTVTKATDDWLSTMIDGTYYDVFMEGGWYVILRRNGEVIFDKRRFDNEDFLKLLV